VEARSGLRTMCRIRPPLPQEQQAAYRNDNALAPVVIRKDRRTLYVSGAPNGGCFSFSSVLDAESTQTEIFGELHGLVQGAVDGRNIALVACGTVGAGKTFTIMGSAEEPGLLPRLLGELFAIRERDSWRAQLDVDAQVVEVRDGRTVSDLLGWRQRSANTIAVDLNQSFSGEGASSPRSQSVSAGGRACAVRLQGLAAVQSTGSALSGVVIEGAATRRVADQFELQGLAEEAWKRASPSGPTSFAAGQAARTSVAVLMNIQLTRTNRVTGVVTRSRFVLVDMAGISRSSPPEVVDAYKALGEALDVRLTVQPWQGRQAANARAPASSAWVQAQEESGQDEGQVDAEQRIRAASGMDSTPVSPAMSDRIVDLAPKGRIAVSSQTGKHLVVRPSNGQGQAAGHIVRYARGHVLTRVLQDCLPSHSFGSSASVSSRAVLLLALAPGRADREDALAGLALLERRRGHGSDSVQPQRWKSGTSYAVGSLDPASSADFGN